MNLSETAFVSHGWTKGDKLSGAPDSSVERRTLRWFTPENEVPLCGHATVASAKVLFSTELHNTPKKTISFESKYRGKLGASLSDDEKITLNFPSNPTHSLNIGEHPWAKDMIMQTVGCDPKDLQDVQYSPGTKILLLRLKDNLGPSGLGAVKPKYQSLLDIDTNGFIRDIIVTVRGGSGESGTPDFYSRFFAPWEGIDEDPVTGLAHTVLTPYWTRELLAKGQLFARQHSKRGGDITCTLLGDRVQLAGNAKMTLKGELYI